MLFPLDFFLVISVIIDQNKPCLERIFLTLTCCVSLQVTVGHWGDGYLNSEYRMMCWMSCRPSISSTMSPPIMWYRPCSLEVSELSTVYLLCSVKQCILYLDNYILYCKGNKFSMLWETYFSNKLRPKEDFLRKINLIKNRHSDSYTYFSSTITNVRFKFIRLCFQNNGLGFGHIQVWVTARVMISKFKWHYAAAVNGMCSRVEHY